MDSKGPTPDAIRILTRIGVWADTRDQAEKEICHEITRAREAGASWRMIGTCLGITTQAAWEKYRPREALSPGPDIPTLWDSQSES